MCNEIATFEQQLTKLGYIGRFQRTAFPSQASLIRLVFPSAIESPRALPSPLIMDPLPLHVVCCDPASPHHSQLRETTLDRSEFERRVIRTVEQTLPAGEARELHNAAHDPEHGPVTYVQQVHEGGFSVFVGPPDQLRETYFGPGSYVAFMDDRGPGHASKVGPHGIRRTLRVVRGHLEW